MLRWLDTFADCNIVGDRPHRSTKHIWWNLAEELEHCNHFGDHLAGLTTDVKKAFNCLSREVIIACAHHFGIHPIIIAGWHRAIARVQRHFIVEGACSQACVATCGYPEGCPMSVVAMFLLNQAMHSMVTQAAEPCRAISYVDNWEIVSSQVEQIPVAKNALVDFVNQVGLSLDHAKTYCWSLSAKGRKFLRKHMESMKYDAKDLGGHLVYCKRGTIHTISGTKRIMTCGYGWLVHLHRTAKSYRSLQMWHGQDACMASPALSLVLPM